MDAQSLPPRPDIVITMICPFSITVAIFIVWAMVWTESMTGIMPSLPSFSRIFSLICHLFFLLFSIKSQFNSFYFLSDHYSSLSAARAIPSFTFLSLSPIWNAAAAFISAMSLPCPFTFFLNINRYFLYSPTGAPPISQRIYELLHEKRPWQMLSICQGRITYTYRIKNFFVYDS